MNNIKKISPWTWVPTLYFAQGIPYFIVNNISVLMFAKMGVPNGDMALFTSLLYLPWTIKPFWSPFVDIIRTKRWWVVSMQILMSIAFILLALTIPHPDEATMAAGTTPISMFTVTLILFIITAFASATHDIAADGFYMLALKSGEQAETKQGKTFHGNSFVRSRSGNARHHHPDDAGREGSVSHGVAVTAWVGTTLQHLLVAIKSNRVDTTEVGIPVAAHHDFMPHFFEGILGVDRHTAFQVVVARVHAEEARGHGGLLDRHLEVDDIGNDLGHGGDDAGGAWRTQGHEGTAQRVKHQGRTH